jgi:hypothetical protein
MSLMISRKKSRWLGCGSGWHLFRLAAACLPSLLAVQVASAQESGNANAPRTLVPGILAGEWYNGTVPLLQYRDRSTGEWYNEGISTGGSYRFYPNGDYEESSLVVSHLSGCKTLFYIYERGTMTVIGNTVTLYPTTGRATRDNACDPAGNYDRPRSKEFLGPEEFVVELRPDELSRAPTLRRTSPYGVLVYSRP